MKKITLGLSVTLLLLACGKPPEIDKKTDTFGAIIGTLDWEDLKIQNEETSVSSNAKAVGLMEIQDENCTGFLISKDVVMTNQHCIPNAAKARGTTITFGHYAHSALADRETYKCDEFIMANPKLDFALVRCKSDNGVPPGDQFGVVRLEKSTDKFMGEVYVIQQNCQHFENRNCDPSKKIAYGKIFREDLEDLVHDADTLGGSSGSPVFSKNTNKVVALHHMGVNPGRMGTGEFNTAVPISAIIAFIKKNSTKTLIDETPDPVIVTPVPIAEPIIVTTPVEPTISVTPIEMPTNLNSLIPGNSIQEAMSLARGKTFGAFKIKKAGEKHFFKITVKSTSNTLLKVSLKGERNCGNLDLSLLDGFGKEMVKSTFNSAEETVRILNNEGIYYIQVAGFGGAVGSYNLEIN